MLESCPSKRATRASRRLERRRCLVIDIGDASLALHSGDVSLHVSHCLVCLSTHSNYSSIRRPQLPTKAAVRILVKFEFAHRLSSSPPGSAGRCSLTVQPAMGAPKHGSKRWLHKTLLTFGALQIDS